MKTITLIVMSALLSASALAGLQDPPRYETIPAAALIQAYAFNQVSADQTYKGRRIKIVGTI
jgi:hypothetical protein